MEFLVILAVIFGFIYFYCLLSANEHNENQKEIKNCENCVYYDCDRQDQPCCSCVCGCNFESESDCE